MSKGMTLIKSPEGIEIKIYRADTFFKRFKGLMFSKESSRGLLICPCNSIHTCFMRYPLDALFLDNNYRILAIYRNLKPWRGTRIIKNARFVLEFPSSLEIFRSSKEGDIVFL